MAFKNLEDRFNKKVNTLYKGATTKFENGKPSAGRNDDPLIVRKPGEGYWAFSEGRGLPVKSALIDVKRLTLFTLSKRGILFLAKQQLLQTGNTFEHTRIINPLFAVGNAVPFLHIRRNLRPIAIGGAIAKVLSVVGIKKDGGSNSVENLRKISGVQQETYDKFTGGSGLVKSLLKKIPVIGQTVSAFSAKRSVNENLKWNRSRPELGKNDGEYYVYRYNANSAPGSTDSKLLRTLIKFATKLDIGGNDGVGYGAIKSNGNYVTYLNYSNDKKTWPSARQTDYTSYRLAKYKKAVVPERSDVAKKSAMEEDYKSSKDYRQFLDSNINSYINNDIALSEKYRNQPRPQVPGDAKPTYPVYKNKAYINYFSPGNVGLGSLTAAQVKDGKTTNMQERVKNADKNKKLSYISDASNLSPKQLNDKITKPAYKSIQNSFDDPIVVSFAMGDDGPVRFRAYIKDLQQSATPEYKSYQYIGRMEKFVNYVGVQREISFKLGIIAFSKDEIDGVWRRINYLTGLVFPYGFNRGIFQPNIVRLTIGNVYVEQPGYVTGLTTNFNELAESWELDMGKQVPISAVMDIKFVLIEKSSKVADSPFYGISEEMKGFSKELRTPIDNLDPDKAPSVKPNTTLVETRKPPIIKSDALSVNKVNKPPVLPDLLGPVIA